MRGFITFIFIFLSLSTFSQSKGIKFIYTTTQDIPNGVLKMENETVRNIVIDKIKKDKKVYSLIVSNGASLFHKDSTSMDATPLKIDTRNIYINKNEDLKLEQIYYRGKLYLIKTKYKTEKWNLSQEQDTINGFLCYKATLKDKNNLSFIAWFTPKIPIDIAPLGHNGLPGLVVRMETPVYVLNLEKIDELENVTIDIPKKGICLTEEKLKKNADKDLEYLLKTADSVKEYK